MNETYLAFCHKELEMAIDELKHAEIALWDSLFGETADTISEALRIQRKMLQSYVDQIIILKERIYE